jgi:HEAT repeats
MNVLGKVIHHCTGIVFITAGLVSGITLQVSGHAKQSGTSATSLESRASSGTPKLANGKLELRQLNASLSDTVGLWASHTTNAEWLGYSVAEVQSKHPVGCWRGRNSSEDCETCRLEGKYTGSNIVMNERDNYRVELEGPRELMVLFRAESKKISQIRIVSMESSLDAGGLTLAWLQGVKAAESVAMLEKFVHAGNSAEGKTAEISQSALAAIALHEDRSADRAMSSFAASSAPTGLRKEAAFWLAEARGAAGLRTLQEMAQSDPSTEVLEQVAFALSISPESGALSELIRMAHDDQSPKVRGQALFWLGQKAGERASKAITGSIENDPDSDVKKKAVFALSQLPPDQGVPKLIQVAQTNHNPAVRKEAMFWLGQSGDPQALAFFEKVLSQ